MSLSAVAIRNAKPKKKPHKLADGGGLYLLVNSVGKYFRLDYRFGGKRKTLALGVYPEVSLAEARDKREQARKLLADGIDPAAQRKLLKTVQEGQAANSFEVVAREWFAKFSVNWAASHGDKIIRRLELDVFPWVGKRPVDEIMAPELLQVLRRIESRGALDTAHRAMQNCGQVFRYSIATGRAQRNPAADLRGALAPVTQQNFPAMTEPKAIGELLRAIDGYRGSLVVQCALRLAPLVFVRPGELRQAQWADIDLDAVPMPDYGISVAAPEWRYALSKTGRRLHIVGLKSKVVYESERQVGG